MPRRGDAAGADRLRRRALERTVARVRLVALAFAVVQTGIEPGDSTTRSWLTVALLALASLGGMVLLRGAPSMRRVTAVGSAGMGFDAAICVSVMFNNLTDPTDVIWVIVFLPLIEAALRWSLVGGVAAGVGFGAATAVWSATVAITVDGRIEVAHLTLKAGVIAIIGGFLGLLVAQLAGERRALQQVLTLTRDLMLTVDRDGVIVAANDASLRILGHPSSELVGRPLAALLAPTAADSDDPAGTDALPDPADDRPGEPGSREWAITDLLAAADLVERAFRRSDGSIVWLELAVSPDVEHRVSYVAARDVTEKRQHARELAHQAFHDPLTGVANRTRLMDLVAQHIASRNGHLALLFVDLDRFKMVNDTLGHTGGDELLRAVVGRLRGCVRSCDAVARFAGDEFCVVLPDIGGAEGALEVADRIVAALAAPYEIDGTEVVVSASVGVALAQPLDSAETLLHHADQAMYRAKQLGRNRAVLHDNSTRVFGGHVAESLGQAIDGDELFLHYQPIFDIGSGRLVSVEALVRWAHPDEGVLDPAMFLGAAEDAGLAVALGAWVLDRAVAQMADWDRPGLVSSVEMAVNLSAVEMGRPETVDTVLGALRRHRVTPSRLVIEVSEGAVLADPDRVQPLLEKFAAAGVGIAIDDFGTGYSSMRHLQAVPATYLKVDRSFVSSMVPGSSDEAIVRSVVRLGRGLGVPVVAEGVETSEQLHLLRGLGCARAQGFLLGPPVGASEATDLLVRAAVGGPGALVPTSAGH